MKQTTILFILLFGSIPLFSQEVPKGYLNLFDGNTLSGWHLFKKPGVVPAWDVQDGCIHLDPTKKEGRGDLVSNLEFEDFDLLFEWKIANKASSGLLFMVQETEKIKFSWYTGPEYKIIDNTNFPGTLLPKQMAGSLNDLVACPPAYNNPTGEWNTGQIKLKKKKLTMFLNGKNVVNIEVGSSDWNALVYVSKYAALDQFAKNLSGRITLVDHGGEVWFRNLFIKSL
jgi:hypothetical protein